MPKNNTQVLIIVTSWFVFVVGLMIIFGTHIFILINGLKESATKAHALVNILAGFLIIISGVFGTIIGKIKRVK